MRIDHPTWSEPQLTAQAVRLAAFQDRWLAHQHYAERKFRREHRLVDEWRGPYAF